MRYLLIVLIILLGSASHAQQHDRCGLSHVNELRGFTEENDGSSRTKTDTVVVDLSQTFIIPVVVHIIHNGGPENIPDSKVYEQIRVLNEDFGRYGAGDNENKISIDAKIVFCLANKDPNGNPTTGINRIQSAHADLKTEDEMLTKNLSRWNPNRYLNIWVVKSIDEVQGSGSIHIGYSYRARDAAGKEFDGVVIDYRYFGINGAPDKLGRTTTHEVGHYLDLRHPWGSDVAGRGGCNDDDGIEDTPICSYPYFSKRDILTQTCDVPTQCNRLRMIENYMDYSQDQCMNTFTIGQIQFMRRAILLYRTELASTGKNNTSYEGLTHCSAVYSKTFSGSDTAYLSPNPAQGYVFLNPRFDVVKDVLISIFDMQGRPVMERTVNDLQYDKYKLDLVGLRAGLYVIILRTDNKSFTYKLIVKGK